MLILLDAALVVLDAQGPRRMPALADDAQKGGRGPRRWLLTGPSITFKVRHLPGRPEHGKIIRDNCSKRANSNYLFRAVKCIRQATAQIRSNLAKPRHIHSGSEQG